jgi:hypothetical protein
VDECAEGIATYQPEQPQNQKDDSNGV